MFAPHQSVQRGRWFRRAVLIRAVAGTATVATAVFAVAGCARSADPGHPVLTGNDHAVHNGGSTASGGLPSNTKTYVGHGGFTDNGGFTGNGRGGGNAVGGGLPGPVSVKDRFESGQIPGGHSGSVTATCKSGEEAVGGGYGLDATDYNYPLDQQLPSDLFPVLENYPSSVTSWKATVANRSRGSVLLAVHVVCASRDVGVRIATGTGQISTTDPAVAACPSNAPVLTSGGWRIALTTHSGHVVSVVGSIARYRSNGPTWEVRTQLPSGSVIGAQATVTSLVMCANANLTAGTPQSRQLDVDGATPGNTAISGESAVGCGPGQMPTGGGFLFDVPADFGVTRTIPIYGDHPSWTTTAYSLPGQGLNGLVNTGFRATLTSVCVRL